ncbi:unnamed protein product [Choristocarpus tenellus]
MATTPSTPQCRKGAQVSLDTRVTLVVRHALAAEFGVSKRYMRGLWENVADHLARGHTLDLGVTARSGQPSELTPTKMAAIHSINSDNRSSTVHQMTMKMTTKGLNYSTSTINR